MSATPVMQRAKYKYIRLRVVLGSSTLKSSRRVVSGRHIKSGLREISQRFFRCDLTIQDMWYLALMWTVWLIHASSVRLGCSSNCNWMSLSLMGPKKRRSKTLSPNIKGTSLVDLCDCKCLRLSSFLYDRKSDFILLIRIWYSSDSWLVISCMFLISICCRRVDEVDMLDCES